MASSPIILNEREARRVRAILTRVDTALSAAQALESARLQVPADVADMHRKSVVAFRNSLSESLESYEKVKNGDFQEVAGKWKGEPGVILIIGRIARGLSQNELAERLGMREQQVQRYEAERYKSISLQNLRRVASALDVELQAEIRPSSHQWMQNFTLENDLVIPDEYWEKILIHARHQNWFPISSDLEEQKQIIYDYVRDSNVNFGSPGLLRTGLKSLDLKDDGLLALWRARVLTCAQNAAKKNVSPFEPFEISWLGELVHLSLYEDGPKRALNMLAQKGIIVVIEPQLPGLQLDGAAFLYGSMPVVGLTLRHDRIDNFWFTLLHELAHIFLHYQAGLASGFFDEDLDSETSDTIELEANQFASSMLIPPERWRTSSARIARESSPIEEFAKKLGIHSAIVFGRIRRERSDYKIFSDRVGSGKVRNLLIMNERNLGC